ncbi:FK506-binding protein 5-like isoform X2 [Pungitius pungitius]
MEEAAQAKQSPEVAETSPDSTPENGPLQKEVVQTATPSPSRGSELEENSATVREEDVKDRPAEGGQAELVQCTLKSLQKECAAADWEVVSPTNAQPEEDNPASENDRIPDGGSPTAEEVCPENLAETNATGEHVPVDDTHGDDDDEEDGSEVPVENAVAEPPGEFSQNNAGVSVPNARLSAGQTASSSVVSRENGRASPIPPVTEDSEDGPSPPSPQVTKSDEVCESSAGSESTGLNHSGEDRGSAYCVPEPETTAPAGAGDSSKSDPDAEPDVERMATSSKEVTPSTEEEMMGKGQEKEDDGPKVVEEEEEEVIKGEKQRTGGEADIYEVPGGEGEEEEEEEEDSAEEGTENSEEDLYRGAEEQSAPQNNEAETTVLKVEDGGSLGPVVETLCYSEREWKGNTAKSALIRKGYKEMSRRFGGVRRVRGDNYCALRATLYQVLSHSTQLPAWLQERDVNMLWKQLEAQEGLFSQWTFPAECLQGDGTGDASRQLKGYVELLRNKWRAVVDGASAAERRLLCERVFRGGEEELGLLEALKLLMLGRAVELHGAMMGGGDVPLFCWLLFARDSSACPRSFLSNHLSHVGLGAGLEQVEMFLLGYALRRTIQVYRLYKAGTEEFVTYYPDDHKDDWPPVCLVTEDDRHYNVPVAGAS